MDSPNPGSLLGNRSLSSGSDEVYWKYSCPVDWGMTLLHILIHFESMEWRLSDFTSFTTREGSNMLITWRVDFTREVLKHPLLRSYPISPLYILFAFVSAHRVLTSFHKLQSRSTCKCEAWCFCCCLLRVSDVQCHSVVSELAPYLKTARRCTWLESFEGLKFFRMSKGRRSQV